MNRAGFWLAGLLLTVFAVGAITPVTLYAQNQGPPSAETLLEMAGHTAALDGRNVMVRFRASWCE